MPCYKHHIWLWPDGVHISFVFGEPREGPPERKLKILKCDPILGGRKEGEGKDEEVTERMI